MITASVRLIAIAAIGFFASSAAWAAGPQRDTDRDSSKTTFTVAARALGGLVAPNARLAGLFDAGGRPIRTKGVRSVERIDIGVYCIRPQPSTNINVNNSVVIVSTEYFYSELDETKVEWASTQSGCGAARIGVYTLADPNRDGIYTFSSDVGFSIIVP